MSAQEIRARRNRQAREHSITVPGVVTVRLQGRQEDVDLLLTALAELVQQRLWQENQRFYMDANRITGRRYLTVEVSGLRSSGAEGP